MGYSSQSHFFDMPHRLLRGSEVSCFILSSSFIRSDKNMNKRLRKNKLFNKRTGKNKWLDFLVKIAYQHLKQNKQENYHVILSGKNVS